MAHTCNDTQDLVCTLISVLRREAAAEQEKVFTLPYMDSFREQESATLRNSAVEKLLNLARHEGWL